MSETVEFKKAVLIWRLRRDLETLKTLCLKYEQQGVNAEDLRKFLVEINCYYESLRQRLRA